MPTPPLLELFASSAPGLEELLAAEVRAAGVQAPRAVPGGVELTADLALLYRLALDLGLAIALMVRVGHFRARRFEALEREAARLPWEQWIAPGTRLEVRAKCRKSRLHHSGAVEERVSRAIAARLGDARSMDDAPTARVHVRIEHDECMLSFDASGEPLHRRGYRLATAKAPLREDLARALITVSGWDPATTLLDPFAGSGTLCIEAALLRRHLPPGHLRRFAFERAPCFEPALFARVREEAMAPSRAHVASTESVWPCIEGSDRDEGAMRAAQENAARAGVAEDVRFRVAPLSTSPLFTEAHPAHGALVTNPPYGMRTGVAATLSKLYRALGDRVRTLPPAFLVALVVADTRLARTTGLPLTQKLLTDHGGTKVRFLVGRVSPSGAAASEPS